MSISTNNPKASSGLPVAITIGVVSVAGFLANGRPGALIAYGAAVAVLMVTSVTTKRAHGLMIDWAHQALAVLSQALIVGLPALGVGGVEPFDSASVSTGFTAGACVAVVWMVFVVKYRRTQR